ncbi:DUF3558 family protein [Nocardia brasiliensis]|uniref:DUF3558 family protein n=1 Tax=Nocardia brasiliensis TaxID=37326 RepID=UPI003D8B0334
MRDRRSPVVGRRTLGVVVGAVCALGVSTGCSDTDSGAGPTTSNPATSAASAPGAVRVSVPPAADDVVPRVVAFDPCFRVDDARIAEVGFDPASRERNATEVTTMSSLTKIGCSFRGTSSGAQVADFLSITTSTEKLPEVTGSARNEIVETTSIGRRPAAIYRSMPAACDAAVESPDGTLQISLIVPPTAADAPKACDRIRDVATVIASALDAG